MRNTVAFFHLVILQRLGERMLWEGVPQYGTMYICLIPFFLIGVVFLIGTIRKETNIKIKSGYIIIGVYTLTALVSGFITEEVNSNRFNIFHYAQIILIAFGIYWVWKQARIAYAFTLLLLTLLGSIYIREYFTDYADSFDTWETFSYNFTMALRDTASRESEVYFITPNSQYYTSEQISEVDTIYIHNLDAAYFMGKTNRSNGRELNPYHEQYQYIDASDLTIDADLDAIYLINTEDRELFSEDSFHIDQYKQFCVVIPLKYF